MDYQDLDVMVLTYNRSQYLRIALSAICESLATWRKTIVLNNASTDDTLEVIQEIRDKYPNRKIEVITHSKNVGNAGNFQKSQEFASNKYVAVFHDDDAVHPEYIDRAMQLLHANHDAVMATGGGGRGLYGVKDCNWDFLPNFYFLYTKEQNAFLQMIVERPTFCCAIYKTDVYKHVAYHPEWYGKLHDIPFMFDVGSHGDLLFLHGECVRWRQHFASDSNSLKTGPFPEEILKILAHIKACHKEEYAGAGLKKVYEVVLFKTLLFNFAYFLYEWSALERFLTWEQFKEKMEEETIFNRREYFMFDRCIDSVLNPAIRKMAEKCRRRYSFSYQYRVGL